MKKQLPKPLSWFLKILLVLTLIFVGYNFIRDRNVEKIDQSTAPTSEQVEKQILDTPDTIQKTGTFTGSGPYSV